VSSHTRLTQFASGVDSDHIGCKAPFLILEIWSDVTYSRSYVIYGAVRRVSVSQMRRSTPANQVDPDAGISHTVHTVSKNIFYREFHVG
jgi:hypothetical protein